MSLFEDDRYAWRETYFVFFDPRCRPRLREVRQELRSHAGTFRILNEQADKLDLLQALTVASYEDHSALEISYREGEDVASEIGGLIEMLGNGCSAREKERLLRVAHYRAKFDVLHFEQTAGTAAFKIVKMPELRFAPPQDSKQVAAPKGRRARFHFDPDSYENCVNNGAGAELDEQDAGMDSAIIERVDPNTLILLLETLCRLSDGVAIDPASGVVV